MRRFLAALLTLVGAVAVVFATMRPWQDDRTATDLALRDLFATVEPGEVNLLTSVAVALLAGALLGLLGMLVRARVSLVLAFLCCAVPTGAWGYQASVGAFEIPGVGAGFAGAGVATGAFLLAAIALPGRRRAVDPAKAERPGRAGKFVKEDGPAKPDKAKADKAKSDKPVTLAESMEAARSLEEPARGRRPEAD